MTAETHRTFPRLHRLLVQLEDAEQALAHGPKQVAAVEKKIADTQQACVRQKAEIQQLRKLADAATLNLKSKEAEVGKHLGRLNDTKSNKEYDIIQGQVTASRAAAEQLEDEVLTLLSNVDDATGQLQSLEQQTVELQKKLVDVQQEVQAREPGLRADVERLNQEIAATETMIRGGEARSAYKRLRAAMGASAMARVEDTYCLECNTGATPQDVVRINIGEFVLCRACNRILYVSEES